MVSPTPALGADEEEEATSAPRSSDQSKTPKPPIIDTAEGPRKVIVNEDGERRLLNPRDPLQSGKRGPYMQDEAEKARVKEMKQQLKDAGLAADADGNFACLDCSLKFTKKSSAERHMMQICDGRFNRFPHLAPGGPPFVAAPLVQATNVEQSDEKMTKIKQPPKVPALVINTEGEATTSSGDPAAHDAVSNDEEAAMANNKIKRPTNGSAQAAVVLGSSEWSKSSDTIKDEGIATSAKPMRRRPTKGSAEYALAHTTRLSTSAARSEAVTNTEDEPSVVEKSVAAKPSSKQASRPPSRSADAENTRNPQPVPAIKEKRAYNNRGIPPSIASNSRSGRVIKPVDRFGAEESTITQSAPPKAASSAPATVSAPQKNKGKKATVPDGMVLVTDVPESPAKTATHWVPKDATMAKPKPILPFVFSNGTKMPGNSFEELWTVEEQECLIFEVQEWLKRHGDTMGDASAWKSLSWKGVSWSMIKGPFNDYFRGVTQKMGTPLAQPYQISGVVVLRQDRVFVDRTWKDIKDRAVLIWGVIAPNYVKPAPKSQPKPQEKAPEPGMRSRSDTTSSDLTTLYSSSDDDDDTPRKAKIPTGPTAEQLAWRVDDNDKAPDHQNLRPRLPKPPYTGERSDELEARFVEGGPCYICKRRESCDKWHHALYMKVPVMKTARAKRVKDKEDESYQMLRPEDYEVYCTECYELDYKRRMIPGGPCGECGNTVSSEEWYDNFFLQEPTGSVFCSDCYMEDYEARKNGVTKKNNDKHDLWKGRKVDYSDGKATDEFWKGQPQHVPADISDNILFDPRSKVRPSSNPSQDVDEMEGVEMGNNRNWAQPERDINATIDDETLLEDSYTSFTEKSRASFQDLSFSSEPDDEGSPRIARRRPVAQPSRQTMPVAPVRRPNTHPTEASIPDFEGPGAQRTMQTFSPAARGQPLFRDADSRRPR